MPMRPRWRSQDIRPLMLALSFGLVMGCGDAGSEKLFETRVAQGVVFTRVLETDPPIRLVTPDRDPMGGLSYAVAWDADLAVVDHIAGNVKVFDKQGQYRFTIGRPGDGPGEFRMPESATVDGNGHLLVRDRHRVTTFDAAGKPVDFLSFPGYGGHGIATVVPDDNVLLATQLATDDGVTFGPLVHVFDRDGQVVRSLGTAPKPHDPWEEVFLVGTAAVSLDGTVAWGIQSRPVLELSGDWGRTMHTVDIGDLPRPDWKRLGKRAWKDFGDDPDGWLTHYVSRFPLLNDIGFVRRRAVLKFFRIVDGPDRFIYVTVDQRDGWQAIAKATRHDVYWDKNESGHGWSIWMDEVGNAYAQRVLLDDGGGGK